MASEISRFVSGLFAMADNDAHITAKRHRLREVETYEVFRDDFDTIETEASQIGTDLQFACSLLPLAIGLTVTLLVTTIAEDRRYYSILSLTAVFYLLGAFFAVSAFRDKGRFRKLIKRIRDSQVLVAEKDAPAIPPTPPIPDPNPPLLLQHAEAPTDNEDAADGE